MTDKLSEAAKSALINTEAHQGAPLNGSFSVAAELTREGLLGANGGLTRAGGIARQRLVQAAEDAAFG